MTNKMAESKRLIKEFEKAAAADAAADPAATVARKKEMVSQLNAFVNKKKAAQADVAERAAKAAEAAAKKAEKAKGKAPAAESAGSETRNPLFASPAAMAMNKGQGLPSVPETGGGGSGSGSGSGGGGADPGGVSLQMMEAGELVEFGRGKMKETDDSIERSRTVVANTIQVGALTAEALKNQTQQMEKIVDDLDEIHFSLQKSMKVIKDLTRGLATDKCILTLLFIVVMGVVAIIAVKATGVDKDDKIAKIPGTSTPDAEPEPAAATRRLLMSAADFAVKRVAVRVWWPR
jgi:SNARE protein